MVKNRTRLTPNRIVDCNNYYEICLYNIKCKEVARTKIDKNDLEKIKKYKWFLLPTGYVTTNICKSLEKRTSLRLHRLILGNKQNLQIDHTNRNKLDNRKQNLRFVTSKENCYNRSAKSKSKGYGYRKSRKNWAVYVPFGSFPSLKEAKEKIQEIKIKYPELAKRLQ